MYCAQSYIISILKKIKHTYLNRNLQPKYTSLFSVVCIILIKRFDDWFLSLILFLQPEKNWSLGQNLAYYFLSKHQESINLLLCCLHGQMLRRHRFFSFRFSVASNHENTGRKMDGYLSPLTAVHFTCESVWLCWRITNGSFGVEKSPHLLMAFTISKLKWLYHINSGTTKVYSSPLRAVGGGDKAAVAVCLCNSATYEHWSLNGALAGWALLDLWRLLLFEQPSLCPM